MRGDFGATCSLVVLFLALYGLTFHGFVDVEDSEIAYQATRSLVDRDTLRLEPVDPLAAKVIAAGYMVVRDDHGLVWPVYPLAQILLPVPFVLAGRELADQALAKPDDVVRMAYAAGNVFAGALLAGLVFLLARQFGASQRGAILATLVGGAATMLWPYAQGTFVDLPFALAVALAVLLLVRADARASVFLLLLAGLAHGVATSLRPTGLVLLLPILVWLRRPGRVLAFLLPFAACIAGVVWLDLEVFGRPLRASYLGQSGAAAVELTHSFTLSAFGLVASDGKGLFTLSPALILALLALPRLFRERPRDARLVAWIGVVLVATFAAWWGWHGGWCWGPRYLLPCVPLLAAVSGLWFDSLGGVAKVFTLLLVLVSTGIQVLAVAVPHRIYMAVIAKGAEPHAPGAEDLPHYYFYWRTSPIVGHARILAHKLTRDDEVYTQRELFGRDDDRPVDATTAAHPEISRYDRGFDHLAVVRVFQKGYRGVALAALAAGLLVLVGCGLHLRRRLRVAVQPLPSATRTPNSDDST